MFSGARKKFTIVSFLVVAVSLVLAGILVTNFNDNRSGILRIDVTEKKKTFEISYPDLNNRILKNNQIFVPEPVSTVQFKYKARNQNVLQLPQKFHPEFFQNGKKVLQKNLTNLQNSSVIQILCHPELSFEDETVTQNNGVLLLFHKTKDLKSFMDLLFP